MESADIMSRAKDRSRAAPEMLNDGARAARRATMRKLMITSVGLAVALNGMSTRADAPKEVIATNRPTAAQLTPVATPTPNVAPVNYLFRGQSDDKPIRPTMSQEPPAAPLQLPIPAANQPIISGPTYSQPSFMAAPFDPSQAPLPGGSFDNNEPGALPYRWYGSFEYLYWWIRDGGLPPLVTTGSPTDAIPGVLNPTLGPSTQIIYGNQSIDTQGRSGARFELGRWFGCGTPWAIEGGLFFLGQRTASFSAGGDGSPNSPVVARPFFEDNRQVESVEYVNFPGFVSGTINITSTNNFYGANLDWRRRIWCNPGCQRRCNTCNNSCWRVDGQLGFRYLHFDEDLSIAETPTSVVPLVNEAGLLFPAGTSQALTDSFQVRNDFYGAMFGLITEWQRGRWNLSLSTRVSLGSTHEKVEIAGSQTLFVPGAAPVTVSGGLLARPSNIGTYTSNSFAVVPEVGFNVGYQVTPHWRVFAGYSFLYWSDMVRVGDQIDRTVNLGGLPLSIQPGQTSIFTGQVIPAGDPNRPAPILKETDFWAQGINVGFQWTW